jgi:hypothetical protein
MSLPHPLMARAAQHSLEQAQFMRSGHLLRNFEAVRPYLELTGDGPTDSTEWYNAQLADRSRLLVALRSTQRDRSSSTAAEPAGQRVPTMLHRHFESGAVDFLGRWQTLVFLPFSESGIDLSSGLSGSEGTIETAGLYLGPSWWGDLSYDEGEPGKEAWWVHSWTSLVAFPPPPLPSLLTYRFSLYIRTFIFTEVLFGSLMNFLSVSEIRKLSDNPIVTGGSDSWPMELHFPLPNAWRYGEKSGYVDVVGSIMVEANDIPAVSLLTGVIASVARGGLELKWGAAIPGRTTSLEHQWEWEGFGLLEYRYTPEQVLAPLLSTSRTG